MNDVTIWAEHGGLIGMIIFALFVTIITMVYKQGVKDKENTQFIKTLIDDEREDRKQNQAGHLVAYGHLAEAIDRLSSRLK